LRSSYSLPQPKKRLSSSRAQAPTSTRHFHSGRGGLRFLRRNTPLCHRSSQVRYVKTAEGTAEARYLYGQGWARMLLALAAGVRDSAVVMVTGKIRQKDLAFPQAPPPQPHQPASPRVTTAAMAEPALVSTPQEQPLGPGTPVGRRVVVEAAPAGIQTTAAQLRTSTNASRTARAG
jgi:hypothetical protein